MPVWFNGRAANSNWQMGRSIPPAGSNFPGSGSTDVQVRSMSRSAAHIAVCICTFRRPQLLWELLAGLSEQETDGRFTYSIIVVDNDRAQSAREVSEEFGRGRSIRITYVVEAVQSIALARNTAVRNAEGDFVAFIDDDEVPVPRWLLSLFETCVDRGVQGALGPVFPKYLEPPPKWVVKGRFYDRPSYPTGFVIDWRKGRTGNTLLRHEVFRGEEEPFRPEFRTGEDQDFFRRMIAKGHVFVWCHEAMAYEAVPASRWDRRFLLRRALLRGYTSREHPTFGATDVAKSVLAAPIYAVALPLTLLLGQGLFMSILVRLFDHIGRLLGVLGINPVREAYVTEPSQQVPL
jgi:succinoglycan biosynthesis protein ExoM